MNEIRLRIACSQTCHSKHNGTFWVLISLPSLITIMSSSIKIFGKSPLVSWWSCEALDDKPNPSSQLSPSEPLCLQVWFHELFHVMLKNRIQLDEILSIVDPIRLVNKAMPPFCIHYCLAYAKLSALKNGQNHSKSLMSSVEWSLPGNIQGCTHLPWTPKHLPNVRAIDLRML